MCSTRNIVSITCADDEDAPGTALGPENTEIGEILSPLWRSLEYFRDGDQVNKKEQNITGVIGKLYRVRGMEDTGQCGEYGLGKGEGCLEERPLS